MSIFADPLVRQMIADKAGAPLADLLFDMGATQEEIAHAYAGSLPLNVDGMGEQALAGWLGCIGEPQQADFVRSISVRAETGKWGGIKRNWKASCAYWYVPQWWGRDYDKSLVAKAGERTYETEAPAMRALMRLVLAMPWARVMVERTASVSSDAWRAAHLPDFAEGWLKQISSIGDREVRILRGQLITYLSGSNAFVLDAVPDGSGRLEIPIYFVYDRESRYMILTQSVPTTPYVSLIASD